MPSKMAQVTNEGPAEPALRGLHVSAHLKGTPFTGCSSLLAVLSIAGSTVPSTAVMSAR